MSGPIEADIRAVADRFVQLQEQRHRADYDHTATFIRVEALQIVANVEEAFAAWHRVRRQPNATVFLAALMLQRHWSR